VTTIAIVQLLSIAVWAGGLLALGAIVAPIVFRTVPAPTSADAMSPRRRSRHAVGPQRAPTSRVGSAWWALPFSR
jgi:putative copper export protein